MYLRNLSVGIGILLTTVFVYDAVRIVRALRASAGPAMDAVAYTARPKTVDARLLVIGDSTAVGTGAATAANSVAGRIGAEVPNLWVENHAQNGARVRDLAAQLASASPGPFDAVLIQVGGTDILRWTGLERLRREVAAILERAKSRTGHVALIVPGLVGNAPAVPWPLSYLMNHRARQVRDLFRARAGVSGVDFVDLVSAGRGNASPGPKTSGDMGYARDGFHPSGATYGHWYAALVAQTPMLSWLCEGGSSPEISDS